MQWFTPLTKHPWWSLAPTFLTLGRYLGKGLWTTVPKDLVNHWGQKAWTWGAVNEAQAPRLTCRQSRHKYVNDLEPWRRWLKTSRIPWRQSLTSIMPKTQPHKSQRVSHILEQRQGLHALLTAPPGQSITKMCSNYREKRLRSCPLGCP